MNSIIPDYDIIISYFFTNFDLVFDYNKKDRQKLINLVTRKENFKNNFKNIKHLTPTILKWKTWDFPVFIKSNKTSLSNNYLNFDIFVNTFLLLSGWQEWVNTDFDLHGRFKYSNSLQYKHNFTTTPVVTIYFELLYEIAQKNNIKITRKKFDTPIVFTHDIDQLRSGWFEDIKYELNNLKIRSFFNIPKSIFIKIFGLKDSYYKSFEKMMKIERQNDLKSISFFMTKKSHQDADYILTKKRFKNLLFKYSENNEINLHAGYNTYNNEDEFKFQLKLLNEISLKKSTKIRQHFLKYNIQLTPFIHENIGITHDFSLGFAEMYGFRNSIASPFYLFDFINKKNYTVLEIPLFFMDGTITTYLKENNQEVIQEVLKHTEKILTHFNTHFSILFHNTAFSSKKYLGFTEMYINFVKLSKQKWE